MFSLRHLDVRRIRQENTTLHQDRTETRYQAMKTSNLSQSCSTLTSADFFIDLHPPACRCSNIISKDLCQNPFITISWSSSLNNVLLWSQHSTVSYNLSPVNYIFLFTFYHTDTMESSRINYDSLRSCSISTTVQTTITRWL